jgi:hypothetical protein
LEQPADNRVYGRLGDRSAHATKAAQTIVSPTAAGNGTIDVGIDTSTASFVIDPRGDSGIRKPFRLVHSMQTRSMPRGDRVRREQTTAIDAVRPTFRDSTSAESAVGVERRKSAI